VFGRTGNLSTGVVGKRITRLELSEHDDEESALKRLLTATRPAMIRMAPRSMIAALPMILLIYG
jgi:hypothetical protein